jgi:hypothetical protein
MALPWIIFQRDRLIFEQEFPQWRIRKIRPMLPVRFIVSGGLSFRNIMPSFTFGAWRAIERCLTPFMDEVGMFALIVLERTEEQ